MFKLIGFVNASWAPLKWVVGFENVGYEWTSNVVYAWLYTFDRGCESLPPSSSSLSLPSSIFKSLSSHKSLYFASRKRILRKIKVNNIKLLDPRTILIYDINSKETIFEKREFFKIQKIKRTEEKKLSTIKETLEKAVVKRISKKGSVGVLFSGGIDSLLIIMILLKLKIPFAAYFAHSKEYGKDKDLVFVKELSKLYKFKLKIACVDKKDVEKEIPKIVKIIDSANPIAVGVGLPIYFASRLARKDGIEILFSGLGADELFAGYFKFRESKNISKDTIDLLHKMYRSDLLRDTLITKNLDIQIKFPYLDKDMITFALSLEDEDKINKLTNKVILRNLGKTYRLPEKYYLRKKVAAQYGSGFDKVLEKLTKKNKFTNKSEYLNSFLKEKRKKIKLVSLYSGGKDSNLSLWLMQKQGYEVSCLISVIPENKDSYMYQKPELEIIKKQAKALDIPLITKHTKGEKEKELLVLKAAIVEAKEKYDIKGVVSGALYSNYQKERIQRICDELNLKMFTPLWHKDQREELKELLDNNFEIMIVKIAGLGLTIKWLGKILNLKDLEELKKLNKKYGFNVAGEGGEYETIVLNAPNFKKKIKIPKFKKILENEFTGHLEF
ncbi:MAG: diphthine--ammonia ligase [archaeon]|nr:diphthine--ammonia ligase [archaeon]MDD2477748.1 diphthine--ammonia ligase [Candidatus ainarchaeum sp.]MDD3084629.1 diphthine--ammonia ligase [Candidatus ainarchaeum sp.]MDD4221325.1 diphthine--ammonia ligase [Candidatus ainarchaeum sp.]MDD4662834.1 diphthine--ammonia ligase [Candidatus ainarchaeum sp.]